MAFLEFQNSTLIPTDEIVRIRTALESIAVSLNRALALPEGPAYPEKPIGPSAIGSYAQSVVPEEDAERVRAGLHAAGLQDSDIEARIVAMMSGDEMEPTE